MSYPVFSVEQESLLTRCDAWLQELDLLIARFEAREPVYHPLSRLWDIGDEQEPVTSDIAGSIETA